MRLKQIIFFATLAVALSYAQNGVRAWTPATISLYMPANRGVLDLGWDNSAQYLLDQLLNTGFTVEIAKDGQPNLVGQPNPSVAYLIPTQNGPAFYSDTEDMKVIQEYLRSGGLVVLGDATHGDGAAMKQFVSKALDYEGAWTPCATATHSALKLHWQLQLNSYAKSFLQKAVWPDNLEDAPSMTARASCFNNDPSALTWPLYHIEGDNHMAVAQAYGLRGVRGAIVWLGYSWREGHQDSWGALLKTVIEAFQDGAFQDWDGKTLQSDQDALDQVFSVVPNLEESTQDIVRRFLQTGAVPVYPPPSTPPPETGTFVTFQNLLGMGMLTERPAKPMIWYDDTDFRQYRKPRNPLNLIFHDKINGCPVTNGTCTQCPRAWQVTKNIQNATILFREPFQLDTIYITQIQNPGVLVVELLPWPAVTVPAFPNLAVRPGTLPPPIWNVTTDPTICGGTLTIPLGNRAGTDKRVPKRGSQDNIPRPLRSTTLGGINIIVKDQPKKGQGNTFILDVRFDGRVLYPIDPTIYAST